LFLAAFAIECRAGICDRRHCGGGVLARRAGGAGPTKQRAPTGQGQLFRMGSCWLTNDGRPAVCINSGAEQAVSVFAGLSILPHTILRRTGLVASRFGVLSKPTPRRPDMLVWRDNSEAIRSPLGEMVSAHHDAGSGYGGTSADRGRDRRGLPCGAIWTVAGRARQQRNAAIRSRMA